MHNVLAVVLIAAVGFLVAPKAPDPRQQALRVFRARYVEVLWQLERPIVAELTGDGEADLAVQGSRGPDFALGVIVGPIGPLSPMLSMVWPAAGNPVSSDCVRSVAPVLATESVALPSDLWGCLSQDAPTEFCAGVRQLQTWLRDAAARGMQGLLVTGNGCEELHLYWNPQSKQLDHWKVE